MQSFQLVEGRGPRAFPLSVMLQPCASAAAVCSGRLSPGFVQDASYAGLRVRGLAAVVHGVQEMLV